MARGRPTRRGQLTGRTGSAAWQSDPFGTAELRRVVLDAWAASPARFREDANAEEALAVGGYAGRVLVELASNAVDAAQEAGVPARIRIRLRDGELRVANTGAVLTADGVAALSSLRASAKRDTFDSVGHFGVGFTAVLSWSSVPRVLSTSGGVRFDGAATRAEITARGHPALDRELTRRAGQVPVLRLPWPTGPDEDPPPAGYSTEVRLPLLPAAAAEVERILADEATAEDLFWALSDLAEIDLPDRVVRCGIDGDGLTVIADGRTTKRYRTADLTGHLPAELLAERPIEERGRAHWRITWALPVGADQDLDDLAALALDGTAGRTVRPTTVGAPTPTDEPLTLPARLVGTFPVDDTRRRLAAGPLCDYLLERAADAYLDLVAATPPGDRWELLPAGGFPAGPVDGTVRSAVLDRVAVTPLLLTAAGDLVIPADACLLPGLGAEGAALFGQAIPGLLPPVRSAAETALRGLGVTMLSWSQASSAIAGIERDAEFWWHIYEAASTAERPPIAEDLADIPIPLTGGRRALGARGCLLPDVVGWDLPGAVSPGDRIDADLARRTGEVIPTLRIVEPRAAHPLLERLGARPADPDTLLADPAMTAAIDRIRADLEDADPDPDEMHDLAAVVLDLLAAGGRAGRAANVQPGDAVADAGRVLFGELVLTDEDGQPWPASELLVPGAALASVLAPDADRPVVGREWSARYPTDVLVAAGVRAGFAVVSVSDRNRDQVELPDLDEWLDQTAVETTEAFTAVADLDLVDPDQWPAALALIAADRDASACLTPSTAGLSYSGWWLSRNAVLGGRPPEYWRAPTAGDLVGLYDPLPTALDAQLARAIGVRMDLIGAAADDPQALLDRLADPARRVTPGRVAAVTAAVVGALAGVDGVDLPSGVRTLSGEVVDAVDASVLDQPWLAQLLPASLLVPGGADPSLVARVLDLPLASEVIGAPVLTPTDSPAGPAALDRPGPAALDRLERAAAAVGLRLADHQITVVDQLSVAVNGAEPVRVRWWCRGDRWWVDGSADAAGRAVAWAAGAWPARHRAIAAAGEDWLAVAEDAVC